MKFGGKNMSLTKINASAATLSKNRTEGAINTLSGMCATCVDGCIGMCEIGKSAYRGHEIIYPQPFGIITSACEKIYPVDLSHFTILVLAALLVLGGLRQIVITQFFQMLTLKEVFVKIILLKSKCR